jgi:hypothetical protein|tara:strand:+ start:1501 stop:1710 length:210 start_codon:yes stop_codon:yes gene_type:complete
MAQQPGGISTACVKCGMEKGYSLATCPTCKLIEATERNNNSYQSTGDAGLPEFLGVMTAIVFILWLLFW